MLEISTTPRSLVAAIMMLGRHLVPQWEGWPPVTGILALVGSGKSQAYEALERLRTQVLPNFAGRTGRPPATPVDDGRLEALFTTIRQYLVSHPGAVCDTGERCTYSDGFRRFVIELHTPGHPGDGLTVERLSSVTGVPLGTLKEWLYPAVCRPAAQEQAPEDVTTDDKSGTLPTLTVSNVHVRVIVSLWPEWKGTFHAFCRMLRAEHRVPYGDTFIGSALQGFEMRSRKRRQPIEAPWSSETYRKLFPGAQWLGDGFEVTIKLQGEPFVFNVEALIDVASNATMGLDVSDSEDEGAVHRVYRSALETTQGVPPLATMMDNRPSNHSPGAVSGLPGCILLPSTPGRGQSKAPIEGSFGLFSQAMPELSLAGGTPRQLAQSALQLIMTAWYRGRNGKPRKTLDGKTPAEAYLLGNATPGEIKEAMAWYAETHRRQERFRLTREARLDPVSIELLTKGLAELGIDDPDDRLAKALAGYAQDAIARGLAILNAKKDLGKLADVTDVGRYLGGIIRQIDTKLELERMSVHLLEQRLRLKDLSLRPLERFAATLKTELSASAWPQAFVDHALAAPTTVDANFWQQAAVAAISELPQDHRQPLYQILAKRIAASFRTDRDRRSDLIAGLATAVV